MQTKTVIWLGVFFVGFLILANSVYVVSEMERAVKLRFGALVEADIKPGLHFKSPMIDNVRKFDGRILTLDTPEESYFTMENKRLIVDSYAKWRVEDVANYYRATGGMEDIANQRLSSRINDGLRNKFGTRTVHEVVSGQRDELMAEITSEVDNEVRKDLGIEVIDIRIKRIDLPVDVSESVYRRMAADREKEAREHRSKGREQAEIIKADADKQRTIIQAEAYRESEEIRGDGDARATSIYAEAYNKNPEFYSFARRLDAYVNTFSGREDIMLIDPESDFFRYFKDPQGAAKN